VEDGTVGVILIGLLATAASLALVAVGRLSTAGRLRPNPWAGIRLPSTMASDAAWYAAHRAAGPVLTAGGTASAAVAIVGVLVGLASPASGLALVMVAIGVLLVATVWSGVRGHRAAAALPR
jgi:uncharacterized membrane protein